MESRPRGNRRRGKGGLGRKGGKDWAGPGGTCVCPNCGYKSQHKTGQPCYESVCPKCETKMVRE